MITLIMFACAPLMAPSTFGVRRQVGHAYSLSLRSDVPGGGAPRRAAVLATAICTPYTGTGYTHRARTAARGVKRRRYGVLRVSVHLGLLVRN